MASKFGGKSSRYLYILGARYIKLFLATYLIAILRCLHTKILLTDHCSKAI